MSIRKVRKQIHFHRNQRWAISIVVLAIVSVITYSKVKTKNYIKSKYNELEHVSILTRLKFNEDALQDKLTKETSYLTPKYFDPNKVTIEELIEMGIKDKNAKSWVKYTSKGGRFYKTEDLKKLYSMTEEIYQQLKSFVVIPKPEQKSTQKKEKKALSPKKRKTKWNNNNKNEYHKQHEKNIVKDSFNLQSEQLHNNYNKNYKSLKANRTEALKDNYQIDINSADSLELQILKGVGPVLSSRIIKYRKSLGGFHNQNQLLEVYGVKPTLLSSIIKHLNFEGPINKIKLNQVDLEQLVKHPYFNYQTAQIFINYRTQHGDYKNIDDVKKIRIIKDNWLEDVKPYFDYTSSKKN